MAESGIWLLRHREMACGEESRPALIWPILKPWPTIPMAPMHELTRIGDSENL